MRNVHNCRYNKYELLGFKKWNRRLLNLYWIYNLIVLVTEFALLYSLEEQCKLVHSISDHFYTLILKPTIILLAISIFCELAVWFLEKKCRDVIPYVMTLTCVLFCSILFNIHYGVAVLSLTYVIPIIISMVYDSKRVLRVTSACSFLAFILVCAKIIKFGDPQFVRIDAIEIISATALIITVHLLCKIMLDRNREIIETLVAYEYSANELEIAKSHAEAVADARARFLATMSHEIRTPMNGIIGLSEIVLDDELLTERQKDYIEKIFISAEGLLHIVNNILDITKIDAGEFNMEKTPFELRNVLNECKLAVAWSAEEKGLKLKFIMKECFEGKIIGDPTKLRQALLNLISNAVKFTEKGSVTFTVKTEKQLGDMIYASFKIVDTGVGMTEKQQATVFEPFKQADDCTARRFGGTGLGLSITKSIIEKMGGEIRVESAPNVGSKFSFELAFKRYDEKSATVAALPNVRKHKQLQVLKGRVLVCEDNEINRRVAVECLEKLGISTAVAENGKCVIDEINKIRLNTFDVILMDINMPVMDGFKTTKLLREMGVKTPIIAMTANALLENKEICLQSGMSDYITKPFKLHDLRMCLSKYLCGTVDISEDKNVQDYHIQNEAIDTRLGIKNSAGSESLHKKMLKLYLKNGRNTYARLKKAGNEKDYELALKIANLESKATQIIGAVKLSLVLVGLEEAAKNNKEIDYNIIMNTYAEELDKVLDYISDAVSG